MPSLALELKAMAAAEAVGIIVGEVPSVRYDRQGAILYWTAAQQLRLQARFKAQIDAQLMGVLTPSPPKPVRVEWGPVVIPVISRKVTPYAAGVAAALGGVGYLIGRATR